MKKIEASDNVILTEEELKNLENKVHEKFVDLLNVFPFNMEDQNLKETPKRLAKMYVRELFTGSFTKPPKITLFKNDYGTNAPIMTGPLTVRSMCSHHFMPIFGNAWIGYLPNSDLIGLSKFSRIVTYYSKRPQIQERLVQQILDHIVLLLNPQWAGVIVSSSHYCMLHRGVEESGSKMYTARFYSHESIDLLTSSRYDKGLENFSSNNRG